MLAVFAGGTGTPTTAAQPATGGALANAPTIALATLRADADVSLYGLEGTQTLTIPVPRGLAPAALRATVEVPPNVRSGTIIATQDGRNLSRVELPMGDGGPITVPLTGGRVVDNAMTFLLRSRLLPAEGECLYDPTIPLRLVNPALDFTGTESRPTVVAEFLPPVLQQLTLFIPRSPSRAESDAAVRLAAAVVARYGEQSTDVDVVPLSDGEDAPPRPSGPFERQIVIAEGEQPMVSLQGDAGVPALLITGPANNLTNQARLLSSDLSRLALASKAVVGPIKSSPQLPGNQTTIRDMGIPGVNATALKPQVSIGLDQTRLGRPVKDVRVHLKGSYTPLPTSVGGQVVVSIAGQPVDRWPTEASGAIDRWITIGESELQRYTNLVVAVDISGPTGRCGEFQPVTLTIDGATTVESSKAQPPEPVGFQAIPQALMPRLEIGIGDDGFADTKRAVTLVEGLQRLSALPIDTEVIPLSEAKASQNSALLISADNWDDENIPLPVASSGHGELTVDRPDGQRTTLRLDPGLRFGSLQTVYDGNRTIVIATSNGDAARLDSLLDWLNFDRRRWSTLNGVAVIAPQDGDPVTVTASPRSMDVQAEGGSRSTRWLVGGAVVAAGVALIAWLVVRRRHRA